METVLYIIGAVAAVTVIVLAVVVFGIPGWVPSDRKPDRETITAVALILGLIVLLIIAGVIWEILTK